MASSMQSDERVWEALRDLERRVKSEPDPENASAVLSEVASTLEQILRPGVSRASTEPAVQTIRLVVADDHTALRESIATRLAMESDLEVVATVGDYLSTMDALCEFEPDIVLLDLSMPGGSGPNLANEVHAAASRHGQ
ncbi:MAG: response regulator, partial [Myxococcota bacterium]